MTKPRKTVRTVAYHPAGEHHQVVSIVGGPGGHRRTPCPGCPWRTETVGLFPAEAFRHSANTAEDMSQHMFACHEQGTKKPATCAGFLLRGADHNLAVRLKVVRNEWDWSDVSAGGADLHESYRAMAIANGVPPDDPALAKVRP